MCNCDHNSVTNLHLSLILSFKKCLIGKGTLRLDVDLHINWFC